MTATFFGASFDAIDAARIAQSWAAALDRRVADGADEHDAVVEAGDPSGAGSTDSPATGSRSQEEGMTMATREPRIPGPDHPIRIEGTGNRVVVRVGAHVVADTTRALTLYEANYPPVQYIPLDDVDQTRLAATDARTYCPYKGDASYFSIPSAGDRGTNAVWTYEHPYESVTPIKDHVAFYGTRVDAVEVTPG